MAADINDVFLQQLGDICSSFDKQVRLMRTCIDNIQREASSGLPSWQPLPERIKERRLSEATGDDDIPTERIDGDISWPLNNMPEIVRKELQVKREREAVHQEGEDVDSPRSRLANEECLEREEQAFGTVLSSGGGEYVLTTTDPAAAKLGDMSLILDSQVRLMWSTLVQKPASELTYPFRIGVVRSLKRLGDAVASFKADMQLTALGHALEEEEKDSESHSQEEHAGHVRLSITPQSVYQAIEHRRKRASLITGTSDDVNESVTLQQDLSAVPTIESGHSASMRVSQVLNDMLPSAIRRSLAPPDTNRFNVPSNALADDRIAEGPTAKDINNSKRSFAVKVEGTSAHVVPMPVVPERNEEKGDSPEDSLILPAHLRRPVSTEATRGSEGGLSRISAVSISEWLASVENDDDDKKCCVHGVMHPDWNGRLGWDLCVIMLVLIDAMVLPFQMAYKDGDNPDSFDTLWLWLTTGFFGVDFVLNFFTGYFAGKRDLDLPSGKLVTSPVRIARNYLRGWLTIDLVSTVPWSTLAEALTGGGGSGGSAQMAKLTKVVKFVRFLRLMRMLRLAKLATIWERIEARLGSLRLVQCVALFRVLFVMFSICHWNACIWWLIGQPTSLIIDILDPETQKQWKEMPHWPTISRSDGAGEPSWTWKERDTSDAYIFCVYWTLGVMRTMPAEVQPTNKQERCYVLIFMFFAFSAFAICVAQITQTFFKMSERKRLFNEDMAYLRMHLRSIKAKDSIQINIKDYLKHLFARRKIIAKETGMLNLLPKGMLDKLKFTKFQGYLEKLDCLQGLPPHIFALVCELSDVKDMFGGDLLCCWGCPAEAAWILVTGRLQVLGRGLHDRSFQDDEEKVELADEECLLSSKTITSRRTVAVATCSEVVRIDKAKFFNLMKKTPFCERVWQRDGASLVSERNTAINKLSTKAQASARNSDSTVRTTSATGGIVDEIEQEQDQSSEFDLQSELQTSDGIPDGLADGSRIIDTEYAGVITAATHL